MSLINTNCSTQHSQIIIIVVLVVVIYLPPVYGGFVQHSGMVAELRD